MKNKILTRQEVLSTLLHVGLQLDQLHKSAVHDDHPVLSEEEYDALNATLNAYRGIVDYLTVRHSNDYPEEWPQTLQDQVAVSFQILTSTIEFNAEMATA